MTARRLLRGKLHDFEMSLRGILRGFGLKVGKTTRRRFEGRVLELVAEHEALQPLVEALLSARRVLLREFQMLDKRVHQLARAHPAARLLMTAPGVGAIVALTYVSAIDDPRRFRSSKPSAPRPAIGATSRRWPGTPWPAPSVETCCAAPTPS